MSGNNNATVAIPGHNNWAVWWWNGYDNFQLDIVGFLAILGEGAVTANAQVAALSRLFCLPRILPAPQALIRTTRPMTLPAATAKVTGVNSGNVKDHVHHVANVLLGKEMPKFTVRCVEVKKKKKDQQEKVTLVDSWLRGQKRSDMSKAKSLSPRSESPPVKAKATGPLTLVRDSRVKKFWVVLEFLERFTVTLIGFAEAVALLTASIVFGDGMSIVATILLSGLSTIVGICNMWTLQLPQRRQGHAPPGDVVIRYPNGSFLVVKCDENVARELYFAPEEIDYWVKSAVVYRLLSLVGTIMLMLGVIALANSKLQLQIAWAGAFVIINIAHWVAAALPHSMHWDLSCYEVKEQGVEGGPGNKTFTVALWKAIAVTKSVQWVKLGDAAPTTQTWADWLVDAEERSRQGEYITGQIEDPLWPGTNSKEAKIWQVPEWDPQKWWNDLHNPEREATEQQTVAPNKAA